MANNHEIDIAVFFEGVYVPVISVMIDTIVGKPKIAIVELLYVGECGDLLMTTHTAIFYKRYHPDTGADHVGHACALDDYILAFHGEITRISTARRGLQMVSRVEVTDSSNYLNRMPSQFTWALVSENYRENHDDFEFLGLPFAGDEFSTYWFRSQGIFSLLNAHSPKHTVKGNKTVKSNPPSISQPPVPAVPAIIPSQGDVPDEAPLINGMKDYRGAYPNAKIISVQNGAAYNWVDKESGIPIAYTPVAGTVSTFTTIASSYGKADNGSPVSRGTANEKLNENAMTCAANWWLPGGSIISVTDMSTGNTVNGIRVNDTGPFEYNANGVADRPLVYNVVRGIDLTLGAMKALTGKKLNTPNIQFTVTKWGSN